MAIEEWLQGQFTPGMRSRSSMASFFTRPLSSQLDMLTSPTWKPCSAHLPLILLCCTTHPKAQPKTFAGGLIPLVTPLSLGTFWAHALSQTRVLSLMPAQVLELASLSLDTGVLGILSLDGKTMGEILDGPKLLALSFLSALSSQPAPPVIACYNFEQLSDSSLYSCSVLGRLSIVYSCLLGSRFSLSSSRVPLVSGIV